MKGLDLRKFKKVSTGDHFTLMRSDKGHEIKIAHSGLSAHRKAQLDNLPVHLAEGGSPSLDVNTSMPEAPQAPQISTTPPTMVEQSQAATQGTPDPNLSAQVRDEHLAEDQAWAQDLANGHVTPKTYHDLFAKKDTLPKIGTLFGLMLSGAGSGLAHQPNAVLGMMNQEIQNDLDAQKQSKGNAQNFIKMNQTQQLQGGQLGQMKSQTALNEQEAKQKAYALSRMQMNRAALHHLVLQIQKLPVGSPERQKKEAALALLSQQVGAENYDIADRAATLSNLSGMVSSAAGNASEGDFQGTNRALRMTGHSDLAQDMESKHYPGLPGQASVPIGGAEKQKLDTGFQFQQQLDRFIDWTKNHSGSLKPWEINEGKALAADLTGAYRQATHGGVYKEGEQNFIGKLIHEDPTSFFNKIRVIPQLNALSTENKARISQTAKNLGFSGLDNEKPKESKAPAGNEKIKTFGGKKYRRGPHGESILVP